MGRGAALSGEGGSRLVQQLTVFLIMRVGMLRERYVKGEAGTGEDMKQVGEKRKLSLQLQLLRLTEEEDG